MSSHREAPSISKDPVADNTDVYAFRTPGDTVTFTPILSDINGAGRTISYSVQACIDPGVGIGAEPVCTSPDPTSIQTGTVVLPAGASQTYTGPASSFTLTMPMKRPCSPAEATETGITV